MKTNGRPTASDPNVAQSFSELTHDVIELGELQAQLFVHDVKKTTQNARVALMLSIIGVCVLLGCIPVALIAVAELLTWLLEWPDVASYAVATLIGLVLAAATLGVGYYRIKKGVVAIDRSREELNRNVEWLKSTLRTRGRTGADQGEGI